MLRLNLPEKITILWMIFIKKFKKVIFQFMNLGDSDKVVVYDEFEKGLIL